MPEYKEENKLEKWVILSPILGIIFVVIFLFVLYKNPEFISQAPATRDEILSPENQVLEKKSKEAKVLADENKKKFIEEYCEAHGEVPARSPGDGTIYLIEEPVPQTLLKGKF